MRNFNLIFIISIKITKQFDLKLKKTFHYCTDFDLINIFLSAFFFISSDDIAYDWYQKK